MADLGGSDERLYDREKHAYMQNCESMRSVNVQMNRLPTFSVTLTGGIWFGIALSSSIANGVAFGVLLLACVANFSLILIAFRTRDVIQSYLERIESFSPSSFAGGRPKRKTLGRFGDYSMITVYALLMAAASLMSLVGAVFIYWPFGESIGWKIGAIVVAICVFAAFYFIARGRKNT
ncbi:MAG: hypothetical protein OXH96_17000 [Spirochaetaceae bacterium]|nr:hypothetical protein [Spirochaetaceae bacterium]